MDEVQRGRCGPHDVRVRRLRQPACGPDAGRRPHDQTQLAQAEAELAKLTNRSVADRVVASGTIVPDDALVNFGSTARDLVDPTTGPRSYWFRYGDIKHMTDRQVEAVIGELAAAGQRGGAGVMRVSNLPASSFTPRPPTSRFFDVREFSIDTPVPVSQNVSMRQ